MVDVVGNETHKYIFNIGDRLRLIQDYQCGIDVIPIGTGGIVVGIGFSHPVAGWQMYAMEMDDGSICGWSENLLELDDEAR